MKAIIFRILTGIFFHSLPIYIFHEFIDLSIYLFTHLIFSVTYLSFCFQLFFYLFTIFFLTSLTIYFIILIMHPFCYIIMLLTGSSFFFIYDYLFSIYVFTYSANLIFYTNSIDHYKNKAFLLVLYHLCYFQFHKFAAIRFLIN